MSYNHLILLERYGVFAEYSFNILHHSGVLLCALSWNLSRDQLLHCLYSTKNKLTPPLAAPCWETIYKAVVKLGILLVQILNISRSDVG